MTRLADLARYARVMLPGGKALAAEALALDQYLVTAQAIGATQDSAFEMLEQIDREPWTTRDRYQEALRRLTEGAR